MGRSERAYVSEEYASAYEAGALAALEWIADEYPEMGDPHEDSPAPTEAAAEHIGRVIDLMLGRAAMSMGPSDRWVNALITLQIPLDDVMVDDSKWAKQEAVSRAMDRVIVALPANMRKFVGSGAWEDHEQ